MQSLIHQKGTLMCSLIHTAPCLTLLQWITQPFKLEGIVQGLFLAVRCFTNYILSSIIIGFVADAAERRGMHPLILKEPPLQPLRLKLLSNLRRPPLHTTSRHLNSNLKRRRITEPQCELSPDAKELIHIAETYASKGNAKGVQTCLSYAFQFLHSEYKHIIPSLTKTFQSLLQCNANKIAFYESVRSASTAPSLR